MTLSGSESPPGHCPWTPGRWRCASLASLTPLAIIIHNYFPPLRLGWLQPWGGIGGRSKMFPQNAPTLPTPKPGTAIVNDQIISPHFFYFP